MTSESLDSTVGHLLRELAPQVLGAVARRHDDFAAAEDAVQEALIAAATLQRMLSRVMVAQRLDGDENTCMASRAIPVDQLTAEERVELMGRLWDSLDPAAAAPVTDALAAELDRREAEADRNPDAGEGWTAIKRQLTKKLK